MEKKKEDERLQLASQIKQARDKRAADTKVAEEMMQNFEDTVVVPNEARMKKEALKKKENVEGYSSDASEADSKSTDCPPSTIERKDSVSMLVSGLALVPRDVSEFTFENTLFKKKHPTIG